MIRRGSLSAKTLGAMMMRYSVMYGPGGVGSGTVSCRCCGEALSLDPEALAGGVPDVPVLLDGGVVIGETG